MNANQDFHLRYKQLKAKKNTMPFGLYQQQLIILKQSIKASMANDYETEIESQNILYHAKNILNAI